MASNGDGDGDTASDAREQGVDFAPLEDELAAQSYPVTQSALLASVGDTELDLAGGATTVREILGDREGDDEEPTYDSADDVRQSLLNMVGDEAVGRTDYTDRGGDLPDESAEGESDSDESL